VWRAGDLGDFPLLIKADNGQFVVRFKDIRLEKQSVALFSPPANYTQHANPEVMLSDLVERAIRSRMRPSSEWNDTHPDEAEPGAFSNGSGNNMQRTH
jgi:hypothetical protein